MARIAAHRLLVNYPLELEKSLHPVTAWAKLHEEIQLTNGFQSMSATAVLSVRWNQDRWAGADENSQCRTGPSNGLASSAKTAGTGAHARC